MNMDGRGHQPRVYAGQSCGAGRSRRWRAAGGTTLAAAIMLAGAVAGQAQESATPQGTLPPSLVLEQGGRSALGTPRAAEVRQEPSQQMSMDTQTGVPYTVANTAGHQGAARGADGQDGGGPSADEAAYDAAKAQVVPMKPEEIIEFRKLSRDVNRARQRPIDVPIPSVRTVSVNLAPGSVPKTINLNPSFNTAISVIDQAGNPWPVVKFWVGDRRYFTAKAGGDSTVIVKSTERFRLSNLTLYLEGVDSPVVLTLNDSAEQVDYKVTLRIPRLGPKTKDQAQAAASMATASQYNPVPELSDNDLSLFLDGAAPISATPVPVFDADDTRAWMFNGLLVLRTDKQLISPAYQRVLQGINNFSVYVLSVPASTVVLLEQGQTKLARLDLSNFIGIAPRPMQQ